MNASDIMNEAGAPYLHVLDNNGHPLNLRLCILRGNSVNGGCNRVKNSILTYTYIHYIIIINSILNS